MDKTMARFQLLAAHFIADKRYKAGTVLCDGTSCQATDRIWSGLNSGTITNDMLALDAGATTIRNASKYAGLSQRVTCDGVSSIDA